MQVTTAGVERRTFSDSAIAIPPRPEWLPSARTTVPPRPDWLPKRPQQPVQTGRSTPEVVTEPEERTNRQSPRWAEDGASYAVSLIVHLCLLLLIWQAFHLAARPQPFGYVISSEFAEGEGAESELLTMVESPVPKTEQLATPDAAAVDATRVDGGMDPPTVGMGAGAGGEGGGGGGTGTGFFGARTSANSIVFVVDKSGSMRSGTRMSTAKLELKNALWQLEPHQQFYVIFYDDEMHRMLAPNPADNLLPATPEHVNTVATWIDYEVSAHGGTDPFRSLVTALGLAPEVIYFLTDGDVKERIPEIVLEENRHNTTIHTICFSEEFGEAVMRQIARENRGRYRFVDCPGERSSPSRPTREERAAMAKLRNARRYLVQGRRAAAVRWLRRLIAEHPGSPPAEQAQRLLDSL